MNSNSLIRVEGLTKQFGTVIANYNVSLDIKAGEIHSLLGENGAGKSTLMSMLSGIYSPDSGSIYVGEKLVTFKNPKDAIDLGIGMIYQHFKLVEVMSAKENIIAGQKGGLFVDSKGLTKEIGEISQRFNLEIDPDKKVYEMSVAEKQRLEILKVLYRGAKILILDEPTAVLTPQETTKLFDIIRNMKREGCAVIIITHKLNEVMEISDRITVLRKGEVVGTVDKVDTNPQKLTDLMVGRAVELSIERPEVKTLKRTLVVKDLNALDMQGAKVMKDMSFELYGGEILGVAGVAGSGQKELCESIAGVYPVESGQIIYEEENIVGKSPRDIIKMGISMSFVPEDRLGMGLVASMDIVDNLLLKEYHRQKGFFVKRKPVADKARDIVKRLDISTPGIHHPVRQLSGGNIQKVLLGREIDLNPHLIITAYPARGLDIGASYTVYDLLNEQKKKGVAVLFIGEDLDVLMELCDRIMVVCGGKITGIVDAKTCTKEELGLLMAGESIETKGVDADA